MDAHHGAVSSGSGAAGTLITNGHGPGGSGISSTSGAELLILIVDCNPLWWSSLRNSSLQHHDGAAVGGSTGGHSMSLEQDAAFIHVWQSLLALCNAFLMLEPDNELAILGVAPGTKCGARVLFTSVDAPRFGVGITNSNHRDGKIEILSSMNQIIHKQLLQLLYDYYEELLTASNGNDTASNVKGDSSTSRLQTRDFIVSSALTKALCYYGRRLRETRMLKVDSEDVLIPGMAGSSVSNSHSALQGRILVVRGSVDCASQYMHLMNAVFTAQKLRIPIDVCHLLPPNLAETSPNPMTAPSSGDTTRILNSDATAISSSGNLLQQAVKLTGGLYVPIMHWEGLLQYLLTLFLPRINLRSSLVLACGSGPGAAVRAGFLHSQVDFRAACFCHRRLVDIAFVCSVCLSIFCGFTPFCTTCFAKFKLPASAASSANTNVPSVKPLPSARDKGSNAGSHLSPSPSPAANLVDSRHSKHTKS